MKTVTMDRFGRVLIPKKVREQLGLEPGEALELEVQDHRLILSPAAERPRLVRKGRALVFSGGHFDENEGATDWVLREREERLQELIRRSLGEDTT